MFLIKKLTVCLFLFSILNSSFSIAQEASTSEVKANEVEKEAKKEVVEKEVAPKTRGVEKLEVTGSYIRRTDIEGPSPVLVIDREAIEKSGFNSVGEIIRRSTASPFGGASDEVNLKGIGSSRTLVLINGHRAPASGDSYTTGNVNPNFIPLAAVERIEVLKDGASATYGSDALGGVINIITRKNLDGFSFAGQYNLTDYIGGDNVRLSAAYGTQGSSGSFLTSLQLIQEEKLRRSNIKRLQKTSDDIRFSSNYSNDGNTNPNPSCITLNEDGLCEDDITSRVQYPATTRIDWVTDIDYNIGSDTSLYSTLFLGIDKSVTQLYPVTLAEPGVGSGIRFTPAEAPASWAALPSFNPAVGTRLYHRIDELPDRVYTDDYRAAGLILGTKGYVGSSDWQWDVSINNSFNYQFSDEKNVGLFAPVKAAIVAGTYDPFGSAKDTTGFTYDTKNKGRYQVNWFEAKTNGELGQFLGFNWASAYGVNAAHFEYKDERDDKAVGGELMGLSGVEGQGERQLYAAFMEYSGLVGNSFEIQAAFRQDIYSDFGSTFNPKLALRYQPSKWMMLRTSYGTGFQAPILQDAYGPQLEGFIRVVDQTQCNATGSCNAQSYSAKQGGNPNLKEETSSTFNFGTAIEATDRLNFSLDYWRVSVKDTIGSNIQGLLQAEAIDASAPSKYNAVVTRDPITNEIQRIEVLLQNIGQEEADGIDLSGSYQLPTKIGDFTLSSELTYMFHYFESFYEELGKEQVLGQFGRPRWRNNTGLNYKVNQLGFLLTARTTSRVEKNARGQGVVEQFTQFDFNFNYDPDWAGRFQIGALNVFSQSPQIDESLGNKVNTDLVQAERTFFLTYTHDF